MLLSPPFLRQLDALSLHSRRLFSGSSRGEKRSRKRGASVEFADFRPYNLGDDIRRIDWNAYGRFEKLFLKQFLEEEDLDITLLLDASSSMGFGSPSKLLMAQQIAGALGYVGLKSFDRVSAAVFDANVRAWFPPSRGRGAPPRLFQFLENQAALGESDFSRAMRSVALPARRGGIAVVMSDFLLQEGYENGLKALASRGFDVTAIQILDREELNPVLVGDLKLLDCENRARVREVTMGAGLRRTYQANIEAHCDGLRTFCRRLGMNYVQVSNDVPVETTVLRLLRGAGLVA